MRTYESFISFTVDNESKDNNRQMIAGHSKLTEELDSIFEI